MIVAYCLNFTDEKKVNVIIPLINSLRQPQFTRFDNSDFTPLLCTSGPSFDTRIVCERDLDVNPHSANYLISFLTHRGPKWKC